MSIGFKLESQETYQFKSMISLYSVLGKRTEIENLLRKMEDKNIELDSVTMNNVSRVRNKVGEMGVVKSFSKFDDVQGAQKMYGEWEQSSGGAEFDAKIPGGEMKIKRFMQNMVGVVLIICLVIALSMILHAAAADPDLAFSVAMLCLFASTFPYLLLLLLEPFPDYTQIVFHIF